MELGCPVALMPPNLAHLLPFNSETYKSRYIPCSYAQLYGRHGKIDLELRFLKERKAQFVNVFGGHTPAMAAIIFNLFVINKSGGLIFYKDYGTQGRLDTNDSLRLASLWHSMHAISKELSPVNGCNGIEVLEADTFELHCFQALTGTKNLRGR